MTGSKGIPPWAWVGCGCLGALGVLFLLVLAVGVWGVRKATQLAEDIADPEKRAEGALEVLGATEIPRGYYTVVALSVPFLLDFVVLSDIPPDETGHPPELGERGLIFMSYTTVGRRDEQQLRDFFEGTRDDFSALEGQNIDLELGERVRDGRIARSDDEILWATHRGRIEARDSGAAPEGLLTLFLVECDSDSRRRLGVWFGPDPSPGAPVSELPLDGTVADPAALSQFLEPIHPCP